MRLPLDEFFKVRFDLICLQIEPRYARILAQPVPHVGVVPIISPYMAATIVLIKGCLLYTSPSPRDRS